MKNVQTKYKYAVIATDVAVFTVQDNELKVLLIKMKKKPFTGMWAMPGGLIKPQESSVDVAAERVLREKTGVSDVYLEQLATFGEVNRDPFGRVVSVAYFALIPSGRVKLKTTKEYGDIKWFSVKKAPELAYDHEEILHTARERLISKLEYTNIVCNLLPRAFTLSELQKLYEIILNKRLDKRNFRKRIVALGLVKSTGKKRLGGAYRPAMLYSFVQRKPQVIQVL